MATKKKLGLKYKAFVGVHVPPYYYAFKDCVRPGSMDAFKLPSVYLGSLRWPGGRPATHPEADLV